MYFFTVVEHLVIFEFVTAVISWVRMKPRSADLWSNRAVLAMLLGDYSPYILKLLCATKVSGFYSEY